MSLTKREDVATRIMATMMATGNWRIVPGDDPEIRRPEAEAVRAADALLRELKTRKDKTRQGGKRR